MDPLYKEIFEDQPAGDNGEAALPCGDVCTEFVAVLARTIKMTALYRLSHPLVIASMGRAVAMLEGIFAYSKGAPITMYFADNAWVFNDTAVPGDTMESQALLALFKNHGLSALVFSPGVKSFELGALCEYMGIMPRNQPEGYFKEFLAEHGVQNIKPAVQRRLKESRFISDEEPAAAPVRRASQAAAAEGQPEVEARASAGAGGQTGGSAGAGGTGSGGSGAGRNGPAGTAGAAGVPGGSGAGGAGSGGTASAGYGSAGSGTGGAGPGGTGLGGTGLGGHGLPGTGPGPNGQALNGRAGSGFTRTYQASSGQEISSGSAPSPGAGNETRNNAAPAPALPGTAAGPVSSLSEMHFGSLVTKLVESVVKEPGARTAAYKEALDLIHDAMQKQLSEGTQTLRAEKDRILITRERTENVLNSMAEGKVIVDKEGRVLMMNSAAEEISGIKLSEAAGRHITEHLKAGEHFITLSGDMDVSSSEKLTGKVNVAGDKSVERAIRRSMALLQDDEGRVVGTYNMLPDVAKFREAQRMQEEFLSRITHDLQSPLASINSALEMLVESAGSKLDGTENSFLDISIRNSQRLVQMIRGILDFSKLQSGKMSASLKPSPLSPMLTEAGEGLVPWAKTKGIKLVVRPLAPEITVMADHARIVQVLTNLMSNAIKATQPGGTVMVAASHAPGGEPSAVIGVKDTGRGINKADLEKIFEKFVQVDTGDVHEGVGLGLAIVTEFLKLHSGKVWAVSEPGKGSTFYFTLPLAEAAAGVPSAAR